MPFPRSLYLVHALVIPLLFIDTELKIIPLLLMVATLSKSHVVKYSGLNQ